MCLELARPAAAVRGRSREALATYTCSYVEAKAYFDRLSAPIKGFYTFAQSAHSPIFEEPARARKILREDVLAGTNRLADRT